MLHRQRLLISSPFAGMLLICTVLVDEAHAKFELTQLLSLHKSVRRPSLPSVIEPMKEEMAPGKQYLSGPLLEAIHNTHANDAISLSVQAP